MNGQNDDEAEIAATLEAIKFAYQKNPRSPAEFARWIKVAIPHGQSARAARILKQAADILRDQDRDDRPLRDDDF